MKKVRLESSVLKKEPTSTLLLSSLMNISRGNFNPSKYKLAEQAIEKLNYHKSKQTRNLINKASTITYPTQIFLLNPTTAHQKKDNYELFINLSLKDHRNV